MIIMNIDAGQEAASKRLLKELGKNGSKVLADSYNRAAAGMRTDGTRMIVNGSGLKRPVVYKAFRIVKASPKSVSPEAKVIIDGHTVALIQNTHKPVKPMVGKTKGGVTVNLGHTKVIFRHAFVAKMPSGHIGIFQRQRGVKNDDGREKLTELFGLSVPQIAEREDIVKPVQEKAIERFLTRFEQQTDRFLRKSGAR